MKVLAGLVLGIVIVIWAGLGFGQTYKEAYDAGMAKYNAGNYAGGITDFKSALPLTVDAGEKSVLQYWIGACYYNSGNIPQAKIEYGKVTDANAYFWSSAQITLGNIFREEGNNVQARIAFKVLVDNLNGDSAMRVVAQNYIAETLYNPDRLYNEAMIAFAYLLGMPATGDETGIHLKSEAWKSLSGRYPELHTDWSVVLTSMMVAADWSGYFYRAKVKEMLKDWIGAKTDLDEAYSRRPDDIQIKKIIRQEIEDVSMMLPKTTP